MLLRRCLAVAILHRRHSHSIAGSQGRAYGGKGDRNGHQASQKEPIHPAVLQVRLRPSTHVVVNAECFPSPRCSSRTASGPRAYLFDHLVGVGERAERRYGESERNCGLEVENNLKLGRAPRLPNWLAGCPRSAGLRELKTAIEKAAPRRPTDVPLPPRCWSLHRW
jgi:hypothetical protein